MKLELFHYVHCPFCVRVRLALGFFNYDWKSHVVAYDDETTPVKLCGKKMLPILVVDGKPMNESLDIIQFLDANDVLKSRSLLLTAEWKFLESQLGRIGEQVHNMAMPYWVYTPEFSPMARAYFIKKKAEKRGPFHLLAQKRPQFEAQLQDILQELEPQLKPYWNSSSITIFDIALAAHLWGMFVVPEFRFSQKWHDYLMNVKNSCRFNYHQDFWDEPCV